MISTSDGRDQVISINYFIYQILHHDVMVVPKEVHIFYLPK